VVSVCFDCPKIVLERTEDRLGEKFRAADRFNPKPMMCTALDLRVDPLQHMDRKRTPSSCLIFVALDSRKGTHQGSNTVAFNYICSLEIIREEE